MRRERTVWLSVLALTWIAGCATPRAKSQLLLRERELVLSLEDGQELKGDALVGSTLNLVDQTIRFQRVKKRIPSHEGGVTAYSFVAIDGEGQSSEFCTPDSEGGRWAIPLLDDQGRIYLSCTSGALAKCALWGYWPEPESPKLQALHRACVRMARADYGGDGTTATRDGVVIHYCDREGIHPCPAFDDRVRIRTAWSPHGAVCVAKTRVPEIRSLKELAALYPGLAGRLGSEHCNARLDLPSEAILLEIELDSINKVRRSQ